MEMCVAKSKTPQAASTQAVDPTPSSPPPEAFLELEGTTIFALSSTPYRYSLSLKSNKLRIWLEDTNTKQQWCTARLDIEDYVDRSNAIPSATAADYTKYIRDLVDGTHEDEDLVTFKRLKGEIFQLRVALEVNVMQQSRIATYTFDMEPISLERIDVLEAKMRDLQEEISSLRLNADLFTVTHRSDLSKVGKTAASNSSAVLRLEGAVAGDKAEISKVTDAATTNSKRLENLNGITKNLRQDVDNISKSIDNVRHDVKALGVAQDTASLVEMCATAKDAAGWIIWNDCPNGSIIRMSLPGVYYMALTVNFCMNMAWGTIKVFKGQQFLQDACVSNSRGLSSTISFSRIVRIEKNDDISVSCPAELVGASHLTLIRLGK